MKIDLKEENIERGDLVMTTFGYNMIVENEYCNGFALMKIEGDLSGKIVSDWYNTIEDLASDIKIVKTIKGKNLKISNI